MHAPTVVDCQLPLSTFRSLLFEFVISLNNSKWKNHVRKLSTYVLKILSGHEFSVYNHLFVFSYSFLNCSLYPLYCNSYPSLTTVVSKSFLSNPTISFSLTFVKLFHSISSSSQTLPPSYPPRSSHTHCDRFDSSPTLNVNIFPLYPGFPPESHSRENHTRGGISIPYR